MPSPALLLIPLLFAAAPATHVELVFGGDVIPHGEVKTVAKLHARTGPVPPTGGVAPSLNNEGWDHVFGPIADVLRTADVGVINLETPVTDNKKAVTRELLFNAPSAMARALAASGVKLVSTGNNHARDQLPTGLVETLRHLDATGLRHTGTGATKAAAWEPVFMDVRGMKVGFLSFTRLLNGFSNPKDAQAPHVAFVPYPIHRLHRGLTTDEAVEQVRAVAARCDALVVLVHWGTEYADTPNPQDRELGRALLDAGALAVIGHHPHVLQPLEGYTTADGRRGLIAFSLGNLVANQDRFYRHAPGKKGEAGDKRDSMLLRVSLARSAPGAPVVLGDVAVLPVWIENNAVGRKARERRNIQPVLIDRELEAVRERLAALAARPAPLDKATLAEKALLEKRLVGSQHRRERILRMLPEGFAVASSELRQRTAFVPPAPGTRSLATQTPP
ncbi:CapA family protein [Myxococcus llanfairpwllgwyngyllgogerychwyrndrobwllllantysiliogogogochensis]|uniref:CapA family protein n=1 Tax=Myxococcus llanfairpwllgwyngyllgogerychwyrndrobwllllantysiliogogogochensis TaxID=2590453 RepID=A0A540WR95_9BACT|nr:CapA family protein [Myxococcus llanfairpwllgwyngyllgogerychwyrndrobwllllantysiliogogogochensis]NTX38039.1 CapA family protein [Myxococcus sp. CA033]TQF11541.1 CapA family protein [Myxococcus llanfairpwllgwyngyllgogerychwyrndrobwllllantysiliogogogochensis]